MVDSYRDALSLHIHMNFNQNLLGIYLKNYNYG